MRSAVFNEDCIAVMKRYPDKFFNLAIVDPPYGNIDAIGLADNKKKGKQATKRTNYKLFENIAPDNEYYIELERVSKNQIVWEVIFRALWRCDSLAKERNSIWRSRSSHL